MLNGLNIRLWTMARILLALTRVRVRVTYSSKICAQFTLSLVVVYTSRMLMCTVKQPRPILFKNSLHSLEIDSYHSFTFSCCDY